MTPVDHRKPPARAVRREQKIAARRNESTRPDSASPHSHSGRHGSTAPRSHSTRRADPESARPRKVQRSHSAIGAAIVTAAAVAAVCGFILTRGSSPEPPADGLRMGSGTDSGAAAPAAPATSAGGNATKADRQPPASSAVPKAAPKTAPKTSTPPPVNTGPASPKFKRGQWIAVLDKYPTDVVDADQLAKNTATKISRAGIPAKAMLVDGQYPGLTNSSLEPVTGTWVVYLGPGSSSAQMLNLCSDSRTQAVYPSPACPTYEPAAAPGT